MRFELMTSSLPRKCSTTELQQRIDRERVKGIEPSQPAWKAGALPLSYTRVADLSERWFSQIGFKSLLKVMNA